MNWPSISHNSSGFQASPTRLLMGVAKPRIRAQGGSSQLERAIESCAKPRSCCSDASTSPWISWSLPKTSSGCDAIMVIVDRLTKRAIFFPTITTAKATDIAEIFINEYVKDHDIPRPIVLDRDPKFTSESWTEVIRIL
ncbi:TPA: hypothetical protein N0F65_010662 [Lagenidium giganteum]|uniref:Integrase catalytic domain-containing protein n=1 Tax=Lagenidium giganteum TaxID=4803 RepID=A0AAV2ZB89_9STRA|nr:TPA: hypothetical protein N0F65_010662 [Lagenidium giganteum]